jgi:hypothetical protein
MLINLGMKIICNPLDIFRSINASCEMLGYHKKKEKSKENVDNLEEQILNSHKSLSCPMVINLLLLVTSNGVPIKFSMVIVLLCKQKPRTQLSSSIVLNGESVKSILVRFNRHLSRACVFQDFKNCTVDSGDNFVAHIHFVDICSSKLSTFSFDFSFFL